MFESESRASDTRSDSLVPLFAAAFGPASHPVSVRRGSGYCVHHVGTASRENIKKSRSKVFSRAPLHHLDRKRRSILMTGPKPMASAASSFVGIAGEKTMSCMHGSGMVTSTFCARKVEPFAATMTPPESYVIDATGMLRENFTPTDRKSTRLNSSHSSISY